MSPFSPPSPRSPGSAPSPVPVSRRYWAPHGRGCPWRLETLTRGQRSRCHRESMTRTSVDPDDDACRAVMDRYHFSTKRDAVNFALRTVASEPLDRDAGGVLRGSGWDGDLEE